MPRYITLSMPLAELRALLDMLDGWDDRSDIEERAIERLRLAVEGKDLRATNRHNTHRKAAP